MAIVTIEWGSFGDRLGNIARLIFTYDNVTLEVRRVDVTNPTTLTILATMVNTSNGDIDVSPVAPGTNVGKNLPRNRYFFEQTEEGLSSGVLQVGISATQMARKV